MRRLSRYRKVLLGVDPDVRKTSPAKVHNDEWARVYWNRYALKDSWYDHSQDFDYLHALCEKATFAQYTEAKVRPRDTKTLATATREDLQEAQHKILVRRGQKWIK